jgi:hypothetical protein
MSINVRALDMGPPSSSHQHGPPVLGRVRRATPFPDVIAPMQPSDSLPPSATAPVPLAGGLPRGERLFCAIRPTTRAPANVSCVGDNSPALRDTGVSSRRGEGLPGDGAILFVRAMVEHPAGYTLLLAQTLPCRGVLLPSSHTGPSASGTQRFRGRIPMARTFACLRIADAISEAVARLATDWAGSPLAGRVSHPLDDEQHFMEDVRPPIPIDPQGLVALYVLSVGLRRAGAGLQLVYRGIDTADLQEATRLLEELGMNPTTKSVHSRS